MLPQSHQKPPTQNACSLKDLQASALARLQDFKALKSARQYSGAVYMGRYVVELYLKCLICKRIKQHALHKVFFSHDLKFLLYFTGLASDLEKRNPKRHDCFNRMVEQTIDNMRYQNPSKVTLADCKNWDKWLNDPQEGMVPWLQKKLKRLR